MARELKPILKWAGGKRQMLPELLKRVPKEFNRYYEPFFGGGALCFALQPGRAVINDINPELYRLYALLKWDYKEIIENLRKFRHCKQFYGYLRDLDLGPPAEWGTMPGPVKAARTLYLNRECYNGLYRVNSKGHFNVPWGGYKNPPNYDIKNIIAVSRYLRRRGIEIVNTDFEKLVLHDRLGAQSGDFVYFDPPYAPVSDTANFTAYTAGGFTMEDQIRLRDVAMRLVDRGCFVMVSNSDSKEIFDMYQETGRFKIDYVTAKRNINCQADKRDKNWEVIIYN